jgi:hypothetical protein
LTLLRPVIIAVVALLVVAFAIVTFKSLRALKK